MLDNRQCRTMIPETREINEVRPTITLAFSLETCSGPKMMREIKDGNRHTIDMRRWILECREDEVARCCDAEQYIRAAQRKLQESVRGLQKSLVGNCSGELHKA